MFGEKPDLTPLESRKQLLLLESELNRALFLNEVRDLKNGIHQMTNQMRSMGSVISSAADLAEIIAGLGRGFSPRTTNEDSSRPSWISTLVNGAKAGASLWGSLRSHWK
jgi:hypothetical protein